ncbi:MAG: YceI family protein [Acidimicrobiales bacterium]
MTTTTAAGGTARPTRPFEGLTIPEPGIFELDPMHTQVGFVARHMMVSKVRGRFTDYSGTLTVADDPLASRIAVLVKTASVSTGEAPRDAHLRSGDFFDSETYPELSFSTTALEHRRDNSFEVTGELTIKGVSKSVTLDVDFEGVIVDPYGNERIGFTARGEVDRYDYGLTWGAALEAGGLVVARKVILELEAEAVRAA